jgi:hypothetical protein
VANRRPCVIAAAEPRQPIESLLETIDADFAILKTKRRD